jgi:small subunit ribosomal protein S20
MARHKSALKQARHSLQRQTSNRANRSRVRTAIKKTRNIIIDGNQEAVPTAIPELYSTLDRMARRGILHKNAAARLKSRMTRQIASSKPKS